MSSNSPRYIIMTQTARVPGTSRGYTGQRVALVEIDPSYGGKPVAISARAPGVRRIVRDFGLGGIDALVAAEAMKSRLEVEAAG